MADAPTLSIKVETEVALDWHEWAKGNPPPEENNILFAVWSDTLGYGKKKRWFAYAGQYVAEDGYASVGRYDKIHPSQDGRIFWARLNLPEVE